MRNEYYKLINEKGINDILHYIPTLSYSKKIFIVEKLLEMYSVTILNKALATYKIHYIDLKRVNINTTVFVLKGVCEKYKLDEEDEL